MHIKLLSSPGHILNAVWIPNPRARLIASSSSQSSHFVTTDDKEPANFICRMFNMFTLLPKIEGVLYYGNQLPHLSLVFDLILI